MTRDEADRKGQIGCLVVLAVALTYWFVGVMDILSIRHYHIHRSIDGTVMMVDFRKDIDPCRVVSEDRGSWRVQYVFREYDPENPKHEVEDFARVVDIPKKGATTLELMRDEGSDYLVYKNGEEEWKRIKQ